MMEARKPMARRAPVASMRVAIAVMMLSDQLAGRLVLATTSQKANMPIAWAVPIDH